VAFWLDEQDVDALPPNRNSGKPGADRTGRNFSKEERRKKRRIEWGHVSSAERKFCPNLPPRRGCSFLLQEDV
jgi:hypothetical protein